MMGNRRVNETHRGILVNRKPPMSVSPIRIFLDAQASSESRDLECFLETKKEVLSFKQQKKEMVSIRTSGLLYEDMNVRWKRGRKMCRYIVGRLQLDAAHNLYRGFNTF